MAQVDADQYARIDFRAGENSTDGIFYDRTNDAVVVIHDGSVVATFTAAGFAVGSLDLTGVTGDITFSSSDVAAIGSSKVTNAMLAGSIATSKLAGDITRAKLIQEDAAAYVIPLHTLRASDGSALGVADDEDSGNHYLTLSSSTLILSGNSPNSDAQTDASWFQFALPPEYVDGETITLQVAALYTADGDSKTLDAEAYLVNQTTGAVGSDLVTTTIATLTGTATAFPFTIDPTGLTAGDLLNVKIQTVFEDADGTTGEAQINSVAMLLDVKG